MAKRNFFANAAGRVWNVLVAFLSIPLVIRFVGVESYGLVAFYATLTILLNLLDLGFTATMNREMARYSSDHGRSHEARDFAHTMQVVYWGLGVLLGVIVIALAPWISTNWISAQNIPGGVVATSLSIMGILVMIEWPITMYSGGLIGLEHQVAQNILSSTVATFRNVAVLGVLWLTSGGIVTYFQWQVVVSSAAVVAYFVIFWRCMVKGEGSPRFVPKLLLNSMRFAAGMSVSSILAFFVGNVDKLILSRLLPLVEFGYYSIGNQINLATRMMPYAVVTTVLPRMTSGFARGDSGYVARIYHLATQLMVAIVIPASMVLVAFMYELVLLWTGSVDIARNTWLIASLLVIGSAANSVVSVPYYLSVAFGWSSFGAMQNAVAVTVLLPVIFIFVNWYGAVGAATAWILLNVGYILLSPRVIHRRVLPDECRRWYLVDVLLPTVLAVGVVSVLRLVVSMTGMPESGVVRLVVVLAIWLASVLGCVAVLPELKEIIRTAVVRRWYPRGEGMDHVEA